MADFTVAEVLAWARTKPADEEYNYWCDRCAIGQFLVETHRAKEPTMARLSYYDEGGEHPILAELDAAAYVDQETLVSSFGAFVKRLEALLPAEPISTTWTQADAYLEGVEPIRMTTTHSLEG